MEIEGEEVEARSCCWCYWWLGSRKTDEEVRLFVAGIAGGR
jgi:hypothetical protein